MEKENNGMDKLLRNALSGAQSAMPKGMLERILEDKKRRHRAIFWWLNFVVAIYCGAMAYWYFGLRPDGHKAKLGTTQTIDNSRAANTIDDSQQPNIADKIAENKNSDQPKKQVNNGNDIAFNYESTEKKYVAPKYDPIVRKTPNEEVHKNARNPDTKDVQPVQIDANDAGKSEPKEENLPEKNGTNDKNDKIDQAPAAMDTQDKKDTTQDQNAKPKTTDKKKTPSRKNGSGGVGLYFTAALGGQWENQKLHVPSQDPSYVHRDYTSFLSSAFKPSVGANINLGVMMGLKNFRFGLGLQYLEQNSQLKYNYLVKDVPVIDTNNRIVGYLQLSNSQRFSIDSTFHYKEQVFALPLMFGYSIDIASRYSLILGAGFTPQFRMVSGMHLPQKLYIQDFRNLNSSNVFNCPVNISFGLTKEIGSMRLGIQSRCYIPGTDKTRIGEEMVIRRNRYELGLILQMKLGGIKR